MSVGDSMTCECNNCVDEEIKTVSARHAEAPWRFSVAGRRSARSDHRCRRLKTCTKPDIRMVC
jgi:hypothetical protein